MNEKRRWGFSEIEKRRERGKKRIVGVWLGGKRTRAKVV